MDRSEPAERLDWVSVFLVSAGTLAFEVILTRLFSLAFWHHFASVLVALALTGFGAAGSLLARFWPRPGLRPGLALSLTAAGAALSPALAYLAVLAVGLEPLALAWSGREWLRLGLVCLILMASFLPAAGHVALVLSFSPRPHLAYGFNLAGSGLGCLAAALFLAHLPPNAALLPAAGLMLSGAASRLPLWPRRTRPLAALGLVLLGVLLVILPSPLHFAPLKDRSAVLAAQGGRLERQKAGLHGLTEVIAGPTFHHAAGLSLNCPAELPVQKGLFVDGDLVGPVTAWGGSRPPDFLACLLTVLPFDLFPPRRVLVLNPGGGLGLLLALRSGAGEITALEENPEIHGLLTGPLAGFTGRLSGQGRIRYLRADPLLHLESGAGKHDLILLGDGTTWGEGGGGLSVSRLLTVEGFKLLLARLEKTGLLALAGPLLTPPRPSLKLLATAAQTLREMGRDPRAGLALVRDWRTVMLLVRPDGFDDAEAGRIKAAAWARGLDLSCLPGLTQAETNRFHLLPQEPLFSAAGMIFSGRSEKLFQEAYFNLRPATWDRPYFFHFFSWRTLALILGPGPGPGLAVTDWGLLFIWGALAATLVLAGLGVVLPLGGRDGAGQGLDFRSLLYFSGLGLGYLMAEMTFLGEAVLRLGRPALAVPLVVGLFLVVSGLGSISLRFGRARHLALASALALPLALALWRVLPGGTVTTALALAPAAFLMGGPFAAGLKEIPGSGARAWAFGVNGFFSVAGSLLATLLGLAAGHFWVVLVAAAAYLLAAWAAPWRRRGGQSGPG